LPPLPLAAAAHEELLLTHTAQANERDPGSPIRINVSTGLPEVKGAPRAYKGTGVYIDKMTGKIERGPDVLPKFDTRHYKWEKKAQHPLYQTNSAMHGSKTPSEGDVPGVYYGKAGRFTETFAGPGGVVMFKDNGLSVAMTRSNVHAALDWGV